MNRAKSSHGPWMWPLGLVIIGLILLLHNFLLLGDFTVLNLWPLLLVVLGAWILLRGDLVPSEDGRTFGVTRGSVESATLEINAGEIDIKLGELQREGRLIAGQYANQSRPALQVVNNHAHIKMDRASTPWLSFADWQIGVSPDLPWQLLTSSHLGQVDLDLSHLIIHNAVIATGIGDIRVVCPYEAFEPLYVRSALGNLHLVTPPGYRVQIKVAESRLFKVYADENRYEQQDGVYVARVADPEASLVEVHLSGSFGDAYLT